MTKTLLSLLTVVALLGCNKPAAEPEADPLAAAAPAAAPERVPPKDPARRTVLDVALLSPDHTTLVAAVKAAGAADALASPGGVYTVFAPTNAAFAKLPAGTVETLLKPENLSKLKAVVQHHAAVPVLKMADMKDGETLGMADGTKVTFHVKDGKVMVDGANIVGTVQAFNGVVYVVDGVLVPPG